MGTAKRVGATRFSTPSHREVLTRCVLHAPRELVWQAWTSPAHLPHWMLGTVGWTMPVCEMELRPGGAWHFVWRRLDGTEMGMHGEYQEVSAPDLLVSTESWGGDWPETLNTLLFEEVHGRTVIEQWVLYPSQAARDAALATGMNEGVKHSFERLASYMRVLRGAAPTRPEKHAKRGLST